jgi:hypothetical protein
MGECTGVAILGVAGAFLFWNKGARTNIGGA